METPSLKLLLNLSKAISTQTPPLQAFLFQHKFNQPKVSMQEVHKASLAVLKDNEAKDHLVDLKDKEVKVSEELKDNVVKAAKDSEELKDKEVKALKDLVELKDNVAKAAKDLVELKDSEEQVTNKVLVKHPPLKILLHYQSVATS